VQQPPDNGRGVMHRSLCYFPFHSCQLHQTSLVDSVSHCPVPPKEMLRLGLEALCQRLRFAMRATAALRLHVQLGHVQRALDADKLASLIQASPHSRSKVARRLGSVMGLRGLLAWLVNAALLASTVWWLLYTIISRELYPKQLQVMPRTSPLFIYCSRSDLHSFCEPTGIATR
jgi:hypothetical protein